ncbi:MAG: DNA polymerase IV [Thermodesulfobacteriota bacterium]
MSQTRTIIHLDMDAFYASVEVLDFPELTGRPVVVGGASDRGVVSAASYEARRFGIHSAQAMVKARALCPQAAFQPVRMARYQEISAQIMAIFRDYTPLVEQLSVDEAFLDVSGCERLLGQGPEIARAIKKRVREETGLTVSAGVATNKLIAKVASDQDKPDGLTVVVPGEEAAFLAPLPLKRLWGVGPKTRERLELIGLRTIGDLCQLSRQELAKRFGKQGLHLYQRARGLDPRPVEVTSREKSVGHEETFATDIVEMAIIKKELLLLCNKVGERLRRHGVRGRTVTLKIKYHDFKSCSRSHTLTQATDDSKTIFQTIVDLLRKTEAGIKPVRLAGLAVSKLEEGSAPRQLQLFGQEEGRQERQELNRAMDEINQRYGSQTIQPGRLSDE